MVHSLRPGPDAEPREVLKYSNEDRSGRRQRKGNTPVVSEWRHPDMPQVAVADAKYGTSRIGNLSVIGSRICRLHGLESVGCQLWNLSDRNSGICRLGRGNDLYAPIGQG